MDLFKFFKKKEDTRKVPANVDVIGQHKTAEQAKRMAGLKHPSDGYGSAWYLPPSIKWKMLQDSQVFAAYSIWKLAVLIDGYQIQPAVDSSHPRYKRAKEIADFCRWCSENMEGSFHMKMLQLLDMCVWGHKAAVQVYKEQAYGEYKGKIVVDYLRVMANEDYRVRVDEFYRPIGLQSVLEKGDENIIRMEKFIYCVFRPMNDRPLGTNLLWPVYDAWYQKQEIVPERMAHMAIFGSPSFWAESAEGNPMTPLLDDNNFPVKDPNTGAPAMIPQNVALLNTLENFKGNRSITALPHGSKLNMIQANGNGDTFRMYQGDVNEEITKGMLLSTLMTEKGDNQSRAASQTGQATVQLTISDGKFVLADAVRDSFCANLVKLNYKEKDWDLIPKVTFGGNNLNISSLYNAISALWSVGFFDDTQRYTLCQWLNLPAPDPNAEKPVVPARNPGGAVKTDTTKQPDNNSGKQDQQN